MAITKSLFIDFVTSFFGGVVKSYTEKWNGKKAAEGYLVPEMTTEEYSADMTFTSTALNHAVSAADVVALNSPLPLKSRGTIERYVGAIPKIGLKYGKDEKSISDILVMGARGAKEAEIASKILNDVPACIKGVDMRNEILFEQALSSGVIEVGEDYNTGRSIRVDFGYRESNCKKAAVAWGESGYTPQTDIAQLFAQAEADGNTIGVLLMSKKYFDLFRNSEEGKLMSANFRQLTYTSAAKLPTPTRSQMIEAMEDEWGASVKVVNVSVRVEKNGVMKNFKPWAQASVVGIPQTKVGRVVYGTSVEEQRPVAGVVYEKSGSYTLISKFAHNEPLEEFTAAQALCIPVLDDVDLIYKLDASKTN